MGKVVEALLYMALALWWAHVTALLLNYARHNPEAGWWPLFGAICAFLMAGCCMFPTSWTIQRYPD